MYGFRLFKRIFGMKPYNAFATWKAVKNQLDNYSFNEKNILSWSELSDLIKERSTSNRDKILLRICDKYLTPENNLPALKWRDLQSISPFIPLLKSGNSVYENLIKRCDSKIQLEQIAGLHNSNFIATGWGEDSLHCFRLVEYDGSLVFEKVYRNNSPSLRRTIWFYEKIFSHLNRSCICAPQLLRVNTGNRLSILYYEYLSLQANDHKEKKIEQACSICMCMHLLEVSPLIDHDIYKVFWSNRRYKANKRGFIYFARQALTIDLVFLKQCEKLIASFPVVFGHGDLGTVNFDGQSNVVDWDECGMYPLGYDLGCALSELVAPRSVQELEDFVYKECYQDIGASSWNAFMISFLYFFVIFFAGKKNNNTKINNQEDFVFLVDKIFKRIFEIKSAL